MKKLIRHSLLPVVFMALASCGGKSERITQGLSDLDYDILLGEQNISYVRQARPVLEQRCVVCHGCYDAPCQLKLTAVEGIKRGANPNKVYDAKRIFAAEPTRLFIDASSEQAWRAKGFHSVLNQQQDDAVNNLRHSVLYKMLRLKQLNPQPGAGRIDSRIDLGLDRKQSCPTDETFASYATDYPAQGMPFALPNLTDEEYRTHSIVSNIAGSVDLWNLPRTYGVTLTWNY